MLKMHLEVTCDACGAKKKHQELVQGNKPATIVFDHPDFAGARRYHRDDFAAFGHIGHLCGTCINKAALAVLRLLGELKAGTNGG